MQWTVTTSILGIYSASTLGLLAGLILRPGKVIRFAFIGTLLGLILHTLWIGWHLGQNGYPYLSSYGDAYALISWTLVLLFVLIAHYYPFKSSGLFFLPVAIVFLSLFLFKGEAQYAVQATKNPWLLIHLWFAFLSFALFLASFVIGCAFIYVEDRLKNKHLNRVVRVIPPLEVLDSIHYRALAIGLLFLSVSLIGGAFLSKVTQGHFITGDPKQLWAVFTWILYATFLNLRMRVGWQGRRGAILSIVGFVLVTLAFFALQHNTAL